MLLDIYEPIESFALPSYVDPQRYDAFCKILQLPDPPEMPRRGTKDPIPGSSARFKKWLTIFMLYTRERIVSSYRRTWWESIE